MKIQLSLQKQLDGDLLEVSEADLERLVGLGEAGSVAASFMKLRASVPATRAAWLAGFQDRLETASAIADWHYWIARVTSDDPQRPTLGEDDAGGGRLAHVLEIQTRVADVAQVKTPTLLVQGENDNDVPIAWYERYFPRQ